MSLSRLEVILTEIFRQEVVRRAAWADALGVSEAAISQWVNGRTIPGPEHLNALQALVAADDRLPEDLRLRFEATLDAPIERILPKERRTLGLTLRHYMIRPRQEAAIKLLAALPPGEQVKLLVELGERVQQQLDPPCRIPAVRLRAALADERVRPQAVAPHGASDLGSARARFGPALDEVTRRSARRRQVMVMA